MLIAIVQGIQEQLRGLKTGYFTFMLSIEVSLVWMEGLKTDNMKCYCKVIPLKLVALEWSYCIAFQC